MDWALADFSGYLAADELYDGPFCVLSIVDNHTFKRVFYQVLERDQAPTQALVAAFFSRFQAVLEARGLRVAGITTDGSDLYPPAILSAFGAIPHQICEFHVLKQITLAVLHAVAKVRKDLTAQKPKLKRGRPSRKDPDARRRAQQSARLQAKIADLFTHRHLFVKHHLTQAERKQLHFITRGLPHLRTLRELMDEVYRLFDRRCRTETALAKLAHLRARVKRFQKVGQTLQPLFSPNLEKALTFLDDRELPATSNAVERANRRHRKLQKAIYRVRTQAHIQGRIALDMLRDAQAPPRRSTAGSLHRGRAAPACTAGGPVPVGLL
ncbi:MAG: transposase [Anaerolineales bacterium]|nr:transposase [Anaerolineales bacterium]